jgi:hypothetical protein
LWVELGQPGQFRAAEHSAKVPQKAQNHAFLRPQFAQVQLPSVGADHRDIGCGVANVKSSRGSFHVEPVLPDSTTQQKIKALRSVYEPCGPAGCSLSAGRRRRVPLMFYRQ